MFVDKVKVMVKAGDGGNGVVSFRRERYVDRGGPDGGDGGDGGDVVFRASHNQNTLAKFRFQKRLIAKDGTAGSKSKKAGRSGADLIADVPTGTVITDSDGTVLADLAEDGEQTVVAMGGKGGYGNAHFTSSTRQTPRMAEKGEPGEELELTLELKMIADVGLVGLPNAGKSTLLGSISNARPEVADYPFTTLTPNLGVVDIDKDMSLLFADIPGLIEGASEGKGLGDEFLRHVERTGVLVHLVDVWQDDLKVAYQTIQDELAAYKPDLSKRPQIIALNKIDGLDEAMIDERLKELKSVTPKNTPLFAISAKSGQGVKELLYAVQRTVAKTRTKVKTSQSTKQLPVFRLASDDGWMVNKTETGFEVKGKKIERFAIRTDFDNPHAVERLRDIMKKTGIFHELTRRGIEPGDVISIGKHTLTY